VHYVQRKLKQVDAFEKEGTLLLKEDWESLVRRDDRRVGFDLREVRVNRKVNVEFAFSVYLAVNPRSNLIGSLTMRPGSFGIKLKCGSSFPVSETVILGISSSVRSAEIPSSPVMCPA
jgi:hypothetical protein